MAINCLSYCIALRPFTTGAPLLVFIDEAHQFLNKRIGEETNRFEIVAEQLINVQHLFSLSWVKEKRCC